MKRILSSPSRELNRQKYFIDIYPTTPDVQIDDDFAELFQQLKSKLVDTYLILTTKDNPVVLFEIQRLPLKLKKLEALNSIANFILDFEHLLEQNV